MCFPVIKTNNRNEFYGFENFMELNRLQPIFITETPKLIIAYGCSLRLANQWTGLKL